MTGVGFVAILIALVVIGLVLFVIVLPIRIKSPRILEIHLHVSPTITRIPQGMTDPGKAARVSSPPEPTQLSPSSRTPQSLSPSINVSRSISPSSREGNSNG